MRWQPPERGLSEQVRESVRARITIVPDGDAEHWVWNGTRQVSHAVKGAAIVYLGGRYVPATRVAWAIMHPGPVPGRLRHDRATCPYEMCIHPRCWAPRGVSIASAQQVPLAIATHEAGGRHAPNQLGGVPVPPLIAAMAHEQFGTDVVPVRRRFNNTDEVNARLAEIDGTPQPIVIRDPGPSIVLRNTAGEERETRRQAAPDPDAAEKDYLGLSAVARRYDDAGLHSAAAVLRRLMRPGTAVVTFEGGGVWIFGPCGERVNEDTPEAAIRKFMAVSRVGPTDNA